MVAVLALAGIWWLVAEIRAAMGPVRGSVMLALINDAPAEMRLLSLVFEERERLSAPVEPEGWRVRREDERGGGGISFKSVRAVPGRYPVTLRYQVAGEGEPRSAVFEIEIIAQIQCLIAVRFAEDGLTVSHCLLKLPTDHSGTWIH
jgi:hypothetical protein